MIHRIRGSVVAVIWIQVPVGARQNTNRRMFEPNLRLFNTEAGAENRSRFLQLSANVAKVRPIILACRRDRYFRPARIQRHIACCTVYIRAGDNAYDLKAWMKLYEVLRRGLSIVIT